MLELTGAEIASVQAAAELDWSAVDASIFGTLFERGMDPAKRSQLGAHYTSRADITTLVEPVVMHPLRREWDAVRNELAGVAALVPSAESENNMKADGASQKRRYNVKKLRADAEKRLDQFLQRLQSVRVLDPACGSGNFLYVTLQKLLDLEKAVNNHARDLGFTPHFPQVNPQQLYGIEINLYAHDLAQMTCWIGYIQWLRANGYGFPAEPILRRLDKNFQCADSLTATWPAVDFIVGNPPFLGTKKLRSELGDEYVEKIFKLYADRIPNFSDFCCYWFEKARQHIVDAKCKRAGLLATQGIRGGLNREVLKRIKETGEIFFAVSDREWILDGANVHVSMVGFDNGDDKTRTLDGHEVATINSNLTAVADITQAQRLNQNSAIGFIADVKSGKFDIPENVAVSILSSPNPHGKPNSDVVTPWVNGLDILRRLRNVWIVDFASNSTLDDASRYEVPFAHAKAHVYPERSKVKRQSYREYWWIHAEPCDEMRQKLAGLPRFLITTTVSKHRIFAWMQTPTLPDHQLVAFARSDDYFFGVLHSRAHEVWALKLGTRLETRPRYTPTTCFETFPFPEPVTPAQSRAGGTIAAAAQELDTLRTNWLNPPEWVREEVLEFPASVDGPWRRYVVSQSPVVRGSFDPARSTTEGLPSRFPEHAVKSAPALVRDKPAPYIVPQSPVTSDQSPVRTARYPRLVPKDADCAKKLAKRTLTNLYNERPTWLANAHAKLDAAVFAAYGWPVDLPDDQILERLLKLNLERGPK